MVVSRYDDDRDMVCGNCRHHKADAQKNRSCSCRKSVNFRTRTRLKDSCQEWERGSQILGGVAGYDSKRLSRPDSKYGHSQSNARGKAEKNEGGKRTP